MARARRASGSDDAYNARRRYYRQAQRYEKQAAQAATAIEAGRYKTLAARQTERALATYEDPTKARLSKPIQDLTSRLSVRKPLKKPSESRQTDVIATSINANPDKMSDADRRDYEARSSMGTEVGHRIYGAFADVWKDDPANRDQAIMDYLGASDMMEVIEIIEEQGIDIYADPESEQKYDEIRTALELAYKR
jgi:hypothetical protein